MAQSFINRTGNIYVGETRFVGIDWEGKLPSGVTVSSGSIQALDSSNNDVTSTVFPGGHVVSGFLSVGLMQAVSNGQVYKVIISTTFSNSETQKERITVTASEISA